jgi:hypothetical protein
MLVDKLLGHGKGFPWKVNNNKINGGDHQKGAPCLGVSGIRFI